MLRSFIILLFLTSTLSAQDVELRGTWFAWAGSNVPTKANITQTMQDLAAANFNLVYFDVWRYGYPYYQSQKFQDITGISTDPNQLEGRDILMEAIAEAHRVGLQIEAWFEFGFVSGVGPNDHIKAAHPDWFAQKRSGSTDFDNSFQWLSHCNSEAQDFLIGLCTEVARNYDVDGIELDRIRYPSLDCGYDSATVALYASEHNGNEPPTNVADAGWMTWRAEKLTQFMAVCYDSIKAVNPDLMVSNAPIVYPYGYSNFCQDWRPWINDGYLDNVAPQVYRATNMQYTYDLDIQLGYVNDDQLVYPGITTMVNNDMVAIDEFLAMITTTRDRGLQGHVIWYHLPALYTYAQALIEGPYAEPATMPGRDSTWRQEAIVISENDPGVTRTGNWQTYSTKGFEGSSIYSLEADQGASISYAGDVESSGWYEAYIYLNALWNATRDANITLHHQHGASHYIIDQTVSGHEQWYKLDDVFLEAGEAQTLLTMENNIETGSFVFADAIMFLNSNRVGLTPPVSIDPKAVVQPTNFELSCFPNPFNGSVKIQFSGSGFTDLELRIYDLQGRLIRELNRTSSENSWEWDARDQAGLEIPSGVYLIQADLGSKFNYSRVLLLK